jgi:NAD(P)-dependent dehydrogenase (short-subunit alcohol dehydrogenase family)
MVWNNFSCIRQKSGSLTGPTQFTPARHDVKKIEGSIAAVTGAGSGIGRASALALAAEGARVAVTDLNPASARETAELITARGGEAQSFAMDVSDPGHVREALANIQHGLGNPSVLVNNAGIAVGGYFLDTSLESWQKIMSINLMGVVHCCQAFLPVMVLAGRPGHVVNIASMLGYTPMRGVTAYCATKFGVLGFSESLRAELGDHAIGVSAICPGMIRTNIISAGILESSELDVEAKRSEIDALYERRNYPPAKVARAVVSAIRRNRAVVPVTPEAWAAYYLKRWMPGVVGWLARKELV